MVSDYDIVALLEKVKGGDADSFAEVIEQHKRLVFGLIARHIPRESVESVAQEVFFDAFRALHKLRDLQAFSSWLSQIAIRRCYDFWRSRYRSHEIPISRLSADHLEGVERALTAEAVSKFQEEQDQRHAREALDWALAKLSAEDRMAVSLVHLEGLSVREVAKLLGWTSANVKVRSFRARKKLRELITSFMDGNYE